MRFKKTEILLSEVGYKTHFLLGRQLHDHVHDGIVNGIDMHFVMNIRLQPRFIIYDEINKISKEKRYKEQW